MISVRRAATVSFVFAVGLSACGTSGERDRTAAPTKEPTSSAPHAVVTDAGNEPRQRLRLSVEEGDTQHTTMTMTMNMTAIVDGQKTGGPIPPMRVGMDLEVPRVSTDGVIDATFRYGRFDVLGNGEVARAMKAKLAPMSEITGTLRATESGEYLSGDFDLPGDLDPTLRSILDSVRDQFATMIPPLPREPVGPGASWTVHTEPVLAGVKASIDYTYELVSRDGDRLVLEVGYRQTATDQPMKIATMPAGTSARVRSMRVNGSGRTVVDLSSLLPVEMGMTAQGTTRMRLTKGDQHADMEQEMHMTVNLDG